MSIPPQVWVWSSAALLGLAAASWQRLRLWAARLCGLFVVTLRVDRHGAAAVVRHLQSADNGFRRTPNGLLTYLALPRYVRPRRRTEVVAAEFPATQAGTLYWKGWRPLWLGDVTSQAPQAAMAAGGSVGDPGHAYAGSTAVCFLRGTFDADAFVLAAVDGLNARVHGQDARKTRRFNVVYHAGVGGSRRGRDEVTRGYGGESSSDMLPKAVPGSGDPFGGDVLQMGAARMLGGLTPDDIGPDAPPDAAGHLALSPAALALVQDCRRWLDSKAWYEQRRVPWRMGCLLHGGPGNGKSSVVAAIASDLDLPLHVLDLATMSNADLNNAWAALMCGTPCVALVEDLDAVFDGRTNLLGDQGGGLSFDALLNCVGGVRPNDGVLLFVTSNHPEKLDPAIGVDAGRGDGVSTRPGRLDRAVAMGPPDEAGRRKIAARILAGYEDLVEETVAAGRDDSGAQFQDRCAMLALARFWAPPAADSFVGRKYLRDETMIIDDPAARRLPAAYCRQ